MEERIDGGGGLQIVVRSRQPVSPPRAVVAICHGVNSHGGQYLWTLEQLAAAGFAAYVLDLRGRGKSDGDRFYVEDVADYVANVSALIRLAKSRNQGCPFSCSATAPAASCHAPMPWTTRPSSPGSSVRALRSRFQRPIFALTIIKGLSRVAPRLPVLKLKNEDFSRDPNAVKALNDDPLTRNETQPAITVAALVRGNERLKKEFPLITLPVFILHGTRDKATKPAGSQFFYDTAGAKDKTLKLYEGHYHDLLNDFGKETVMQDIKSWIGRHLS